MRLNPSRAVATLLTLLLLSCAPAPRPVITTTPSAKQLRYLGEIKGQFGSEPLAAPAAIAFDPQSNLYIVDQLNNRVVKLRADYNFAAENGGFGLGLTGLSRPSDIVSDQGISFFILDQGNNRIVKSDYNLIFADEIRFQSNLDLASLGKVTSLAYSRQGRMYLVDEDNQKILCLDKDYVLEREIAPAGGFLHCSAIAVDDEDLIYVYDRNQNVIYRFDIFGNPSGKTELADAGQIGDFVVHSGQIFATDKVKHEVVIYDLSGSRIAAVGSQGSGPQNLNAPTGIALRGDNKLFVCDTGNNRIMIYELAAK